jgi:hypothetical protein
MRRVSALAGALAMAAALSACGGGSDGGSGNTTTGSSGGPVTTTLPTYTFTGVPSGSLASTDVTVNGTGTMTAVANWTFSSNDIDIYITSTTCNATNISNIQSGCTNVGRTTSTFAKPETLTVNVNAGNYRVWIANFGPGSESGTLAVSATVTR